jgi:hypothetical protein
MKRWTPAVLVLAAAIGLCSLRAADPPPADADMLVVIDKDGNPKKAKAWKFVKDPTEPPCTRSLGWLVDPPANETKPVAKPKGPEAFIFRDENSTPYEEGILTLIPVDRLRTIEFDNEKRTITIRVVVGDKSDSDEKLTGTTKYRGTNRLKIEAEVDRGEQGIAAVKYLGGVAEMGIRSVRFPAPKAPADAAAGRPAFIIVEKEKPDDKENVQQASDLQPLYQFADGSEKLLPKLFFKKTLKIDVAKVKRLVVVDSRVPEGKEMDVTLKDGNSDTLTLLKTAMIDDKPATLVGLVGRVPAGYKLFPVHTIAEVQFEERQEKKPEKKEGEKDK